MTEELKIFEKPEGKLKSTLEMTQRIMKVDKELRNYIMNIDKYAFIYITSSSSWIWTTLQNAVQEMKNDV